MLRQCVYQFAFSLKLTLNFDVKSCIRCRWDSIIGKATIYTHMCPLDLGYVQGVAAH